MVFMILITCSDNGSLMLINSAKPLQIKLQNYRQFDSQDTKLYENMKYIFYQENA